MFECGVGVLGLSMRLRMGLSVVVGVWGLSMRLGFGGWGLRLILGFGSDRVLENPPDIRKLHLPNCNCVCYRLRYVLFQHMEINNPEFHDLVRKMCENCMN